MSEWELDDITHCDKCEADYIENGDGCPRCDIQHTSLEGLFEDIKKHAKQPKTRGLATLPPDFSQPLAKTPKPVKKGVKIEQSNIPAKQLGYVSTAREYEEVLSRSSDLEYRRYQLLFAHEQDGLIHTLVLQPKVIIKPRVAVAANAIHNGYKQRAAHYKGDFAYWYKDHLIIEDAKGGKVDKSAKKAAKRIKPFIHTTAARNAHKDLTVRYKHLGLHKHISFLLTVEIKRRWYYLNSEHELIDFSLE